jgi:hypothetical protein
MIDLAIQKVHQELDVVGIMTEEDQLKVFLLQTWKEFQKKNQEFTKNIAQEIVRKTDFFKQYEHFFIEVWVALKKRVKEVLQTLQRKEVFGNPVRCY